VFIKHGYQYIIYESMVSEDTISNALAYEKIDYKYSNDNVDHDKNTDSN